jgi:hypothetical protein
MLPSPVTAGAVAKNDQRDGVIVAMERLFAIRSDAGSSFCCPASGGAPAPCRSDEPTLDHALKPRALLSVETLLRLLDRLRQLVLLRRLRTIESILDLNRKTYGNLGAALRPRRATIV